MTKLLYISVLAIFMITACKSTVVQKLSHDEYSYNQQAKGPSVIISFKEGPAHFHPLMAIWAEDINGNFIQTLFVAKSIGKGVFEHGDASEGKWKPGEVRRPAALPVWSHKRGIKAEDGLYIPSPKMPVADAYTGSTPPQDFVLKTKFDQEPPEKFNIFFEINQPWDFNEYWTNNKFPGNDEYKTSCQPSLIYKAEINRQNPKSEYFMQVIGHGHYAGENGDIYPDLGTMTTALEIASEIKVEFP
jgi:hypothetical protein